MVNEVKIDGLFMKMPFLKARNLKKSDLEKQNRKDYMTILSCSPPYISSCLVCITVTEQTAAEVGVNAITKRISPFLGSPHLLGPPCPPPERCLSMPEIGENKRNYLFKSYTDLE